MPDVLNMPNDLLDHDLVNTIMNETTSIKTEGENLPGSQRKFFLVNLTLEYVICPLYNRVRANASSKYMRGGQ